MILRTSSHTIKFANTGKKVYYQKVIKDFVFTNKKGQVIIVPDVLTRICPKCKDKSYSYKEVLKIEAYLEKVKNTSKN